MSERTIRRDLERKAQTRPDFIKGQDSKLYPVSDRGRRDRAAGALHLYRQGLNYREIADKLGISPATAYRYCRDYTLAD